MTPDRIDAANHSNGISRLGALFFGLGPSEGQDRLQNLRIKLGLGAWLLKRSPATNESASSRTASSALLRRSASLALKRASRSSFVRPVSRNLSTEADCSTSARWSRNSRMPGH